ncbi:impact family protein [Akanthomyces lecanii RCEF 1005]|uniref:Impact family protein n=1 Tax=Akanthomyces lecanii RCEF 1005 TaxID=1081108 RepID=A0A168FQJ8_CORDF|nr:impact family protein [Akanthomyces lecanii RCEF 1005]
MSDELRDEVEAINSIYGDGSLVPPAAADDGVYILQLPGDAASSLQLQFPARYPEVGGPPSVLGVQHSSHGIRGAGARDVRLFRLALAEVHQPGAVCLFDAVEEFSRRLDEELEASAAAAEDSDDDKDDREGMNASTRQQDEFAAVDLASLPPPPWTLSEQVVDAKSAFVAHVARVDSPAQARLYVAQLLASDKRIRSATHNITAWRIRGEGAASYQDCDDDGEDAAGGRLLHLMQLMELWDAMVVVTRWYGGVKLGPRRFAVINAVARDGFVRAGMVPESGKGKKK